MLKLHITQRDTKTKPERIRAHGELPAVFYGRKEASTPIRISQKEFESAWREAGESAIVSLEGVGEPKEALIHDVAVHPVTGTPVHADLYVIEKGKKLRIDVPLVFVGVAPAVKDKGGILVKVLHELPIEALPKDLPHELTVDISSLAGFDSNLAVKDLALPEGVTALAEPDEIVASVSEPKEEPEEAAPGAIDMDAIAVEEKGKKESDDTEGESKTGAAKENE